MLNIPFNIVVLTTSGDFNKFSYNCIIEVILAFFKAFQLHFFLVKITNEGYFTSDFFAVWMSVKL